MKIFVRHAHTHEPFFWGEFATKLVCQVAVSRLQLIGLDGFVEFPGPDGFNNSKSFFHNEEFEL